LPAESVQCVVTSPPYWGLRDYGHGGQLGQEASIEAYVANLVDVFRAVWRVLRPDGTLWLNLGDSYAMTTRGMGGETAAQCRNKGAVLADRRWSIPAGLKPKDLIGMPWRVALALQAAGWFLRADIVWAKPNAMPESVRDRPTKSHEYLFMLTKSARYYYDAEAVREPLQPSSQARYRYGFGSKKNAVLRDSGLGQARPFGSRALPPGRNLRSVWTVPHGAHKGAHFAVFPPKLVEPCVKAGSPPGGVVLDPFCGSGTVGAVALEHGREFVGIELNADYMRLACDRLGIKPSEARVIQRYPVRKSKNGARI
jgi:DNA modification methylase